MTLLARRLKLTFLQLANDLRDSALISDLHARLIKMANKVYDMHDKVDDIHTILFKLKRSGTQPASDQAGDAACIGLAHSTRDATETRDLPRAR